MMLCSESEVGEIFEGFGSQFEKRSLGYECSVEFEEQEGNSCKRVPLNPNHAGFEISDAEVLC